jgi:Ser/Thr protein kinase RdoA (MazF antagonist)
VTGTRVLADAEMSAAESLLAEVGGVRGLRGGHVLTAEKIPESGHVVRLRLADERTIVLKRRRSDDLDGRAWAFAAELAALEFLDGMPRAVAPRMFGADDGAGILLMEDLGTGPSLADSLLGSDRGRAEADLAGYARALAAMHSWSIGRSGEFARAWARRAGDVPPPEPEWMGAIATRKESFLAVMARLGVAVTGAGDDVDELVSLLRGATATGLVHGDPCPDNTHIVDGDCRIFDFESCGWGAVALDAAYLLAPFPSCWCFASLPTAVAAQALRAYHDEMGAAGIDLGPDWDAVLTAAIAGWLVARAEALGLALDEDTVYGTTTMRPRLLTWLRSFIHAADLSGALPRLRDLAATAHQQLSHRWPETVVPQFPAVAGRLSGLRPPGRSVLRQLEARRAGHQQSPQVGASAVTPGSEAILTPLLMLCIALEACWRVLLRSYFLSRSNLVAIATKGIRDHDLGRTDVTRGDVCGTTGRPLEHPALAVAVAPPTPPPVP